MSVWFGLHCPSYSFVDSPTERLFDRVVEQVRAAEDAGFGLVTVMDHLNQIPGIGVPDEPMLEAWSTLAALARETTRVRLGPLVTGVTYRNPAMLAKTATTLDVLSGGRAILGLGAAWYEAEHDAFGFSFPPIKERMDRLDEALSIARGMFAQERSTFSGRLYETRDVINVPRPVTAGGPPILVGGGGEQRTLKIAAKHADMTHWFPLGLAALAHKTDVLRGYCEAIGRDPATIRCAVNVGLAWTDESLRQQFGATAEMVRAGVLGGSDDELVDRVGAYADAGADQVNISLRAPFDVDAIERFSAAAGLPTA